MIIIVNGQGGVGKTTFEKFVEEELSLFNKKTEVISMVDKVKEYAKDFGWNGEKTPKDRKMLSTLNNLVTQWKDIPYQHVYNKIKNSKSDFIFVDARESADIKRLSSDFNVIKVLVTGKQINSYGNHADDDVFNDEITYDVTVDNSKTLDDLKLKAKDFVSLLLMAIALINFKKGE